MRIGEVTGNVVATRKLSGLTGFKLLSVRLGRPDDTGDGPETVAVDCVDAGVGDWVLVASGSTARIAAGGGEIPADHAIVGVIDAIEREGVLIYSNSET